MAKGRPRKPLAELRLMGGFRPARHAERLGEPQFDGQPVKPRGLDKEASKLWDAIVPQLVARQVVREIDSAILTMTCQIWGLYRQSVEAAVANPTDKEIRGAVTAYASQFDRLAAHCGLNPIDRAKLSVPPEKTDGGIEGFARKRDRA